MTTPTPTQPMKKFKNPHRISLAELCKRRGEALEDLLVNFDREASGPACCDEGCEQIEPDGRCEHECPSAMLAAGVI